MVDPSAKFKAFGQSPYLVQGLAQTNAHSIAWKTKDESENFCQRHDQEIVKIEKRREVEAEIKDDVFEILADELQNLKLAVEKEGKKGKGKGKGKAGKGKKAKGGKKVSERILIG